MFFGFRGRGVDPVAAALRALRVVSMPPPVAAVAARRISTRGHSPVVMSRAGMRRRVAGEVVQGRTHLFFECVELYGFRDILTKVCVSGLHMSS